MVGSYRTPVGNRSSISRTSIKLMKFCRIPELEPTVGSLMLESDRIQCRNPIQAYNPCVLLASDAYSLMIKKIVFFACNR